MKARKLPSGNWNCTVFSHMENGKRKYVSFTAQTKQEAQRQALEFQINKKDSNKPLDLTVEKAVDNYIQSKVNIISPKTHLTYESYKQYYVPLNNIKLGSITSVDLQEFANSLAKTLSPKTVKNVYSLLHSAILMYSDKHYHVTLPIMVNPERNIPTDKDINNLINNANPKLKLAIILGSKGMRRGEVASLKYKDILRDFNAILIHSDIVLGNDKQWHYKEVPKTSKSVRRLVLPKEVIEMMGTGEDEDYVLGILPSTITSDFINLRNKLGLKCRFHDLRHYSTSILHALGLPDAYIMEHNGYASDYVMKSVYRHSLSDKTIKYNSIANEYFEKNILNNSVSHEGVQ